MSDPRNSYNILHFCEVCKNYRIYDCHKVLDLHTGNNVNSFRRGRLQIVVVGRKVCQNYQRYKFENFL